MKIVLALAICLGLLPASAKEIDTNKYSSSLKKHVQEVVFRGADKEFYPLRKKIKVYIKGGPKLVASSKAQLKEVGALVGSEFEFVNEPIKNKEIFSNPFCDYSFISIYFGNKNEILKEIGKSRQVDNRVFKSIMHTKAEKNLGLNYTLGSVNIFINTQIAKNEELDRVIFENILKAYGYRGEGKSKIPTSCFSDSEPKKEKFSEFDKRLLKFLYKDVKPGTRFIQISTALKKKWGKEE